jgi:hypothetical protein
MAAASQPTMATVRRPGVLPPPPPLLTWLAEVAHGAEPLRYPCQDPFDQRHPAGLLRLLAALPVTGGLLTSLAQEEVQGENGPHGRRGRRGRNHKGHKGHMGKSRSHTSQGCLPPSDADTCADQCGTVTNSCGTPVDCSGCPVGQECVTHRCRNCGFGGQPCCGGVQCFAFHEEVCSEGKCVRCGFVNALCCVGDLDRFCQPPTTCVEGTCR